MAQRIAFALAQGLVIGELEAALSRQEKASQPAPITLTPEEKDEAKRVAFALAVHLAEHEPATAEPTIYDMPPDMPAGRTLN